MPNALAREKSPYLRQHADNPVAWLPWGPAAFEKAKREDKPIFLSIGYSTCHWCHVMAHESFEDPNVAAVLNRDFIPVKVDREERPDVDRIYMLFVQASTGSGGWPMSVWLTPSLRPFFGGTYFPPDSRYGRPGFIDVLGHLTTAWKRDRERIETSSSDVLDQLRAHSGSSAVTLPADDALFESAFWPFRRTFDSRWGGFGSAPKFPRPSVLNYLLRHYARTKNEDARDMVIATLKAMARGGMHDQLGGGFHRYSVDERWFVPHFEKMLYDQAQLAVSYLEAHQITGDPEYTATARGIFDYVLRDLTHESGAFYSAEDADSVDPDEPAHSREGAFYVWTRSEIDALLAPAVAERFCNAYGVRANGNVDEDPHHEFTGRNILFLAQAIAPESELELRVAAGTLFRARERRPRPHRDEKLLTAWNALMISAFAKGFTTLGERRYLQAAERAGRFLLSTMYNRRTGALLRRYCEDEAAVESFLDDDAFFCAALLDMFEATGAAAYLKDAAALARKMIRDFEDRERGGFFSTRDGAADLLLRMKDDYDGAEPSGNSIATDALLRLAGITGVDEFRASAERSISAFGPKLKAQPTMAPQMLVAVGRFLTEPEQVVIRCCELDSEVGQLLQRYREAWSPYATILAITDAAAEELREIAPFLAGLVRNGRLTVYECRNFTCTVPQVFS